jgi:ABC-type cobalamin/Fe3+-siderophores transport system ATPase subunit
VVNCDLFVSLHQIIGMLEVKDAKIAVGGQTLAAGLSFMARDGQLTCITGPEGSGKTTLLRTLMGFLPIGSGYVSVDGELLTVKSSQAFRRMMAYLPQQIQQLRHQLMPVEAPVCEAETYGVWNALLPKAVVTEMPAPLSPEEIFLLVEQTLSDAKGKQIIIADEPAAHLTPELTLRLLQQLRDQADAGKTVLIASRRPLLVEHADLVIEMNQNT